MDSTTQDLGMNATRDAYRALSGAPARIETIESTTLIGAAKLVHIQHRGEIYSLRQTRLGKLILTK